MKLTSPAFKHESAIPSKYTCDGNNISPPLIIGEVSGQTKSLALRVDDPDAPGGEFNHWLVWNIDPQTREIDEGNLLPGPVEGKNDFGHTGYGGPCAPSGRHRYYFRLFALDALLDLTNQSAKTELTAAMQGHVLEQCELMGTYERRK